MAGIVGAIAELVGLIPDVVVAVREARAKRASTQVTKPWNQPHIWNWYRVGVKDKLPIPFCEICERVQTPANDHEMCKGPPGWK